MVSSTVTFAEIVDLEAIFNQLFGTVAVILIADNCACFLRQKTKNKIQAVIGLVRGLFGPVFKIQLQQTIMLVCVECMMNFNGKT